MVNRSISHPAVPGLGRSSTCEGGVPAATMDNESTTTQNKIWHLTYHIVGACLGSCMKRCLHCPYAYSLQIHPIRSLLELVYRPSGAPRVPGLTAPGTVHTAITSTQGVIVSGPDGVQRIADINMTVSADVIPDAFNTIPRRQYLTKKDVLPLLFYSLAYKIL